MPTGGKKTTGTDKGSTGAKLKQLATKKPTKTDNTTQNNTSVGSDQDFLYIEKSPEQIEDEWLNQIKYLMKEKNKVDVSNRFSENLKRLYEALLKELSRKCEVKYKSMFDIADGGQPDTDMEVNVALRVNTKEKELSDKSAESSAKHKELTEENNKLKDQLKSYQENLKKFEKQPGDYKKEVDDYKKEVDAKTVEINKLKQDISEMKKRISETEKQQKLTKPPEKTDDAVNTLNADTLNLQKKLSSQTQELQQMQQKIDALTKEKADVLKQNENLEKGLIDAKNNITTLNKDNEKNKIKLEEGDSKRIALENENSDLKKELQNLHDKLKGAKSENVTQGKTDSSNKEQITSLTDENKKIKLKHKELEQQQIKLQQQQREESQRSEEKINILTAEKESLETVVSQIKKQLEEEKRKMNKELEEEKRKMNKEKKFAALDPDQKLKEVQEENEKLRDRLSKVAGMKLTEGNPAIADLGDPNRPTQLGEKFAELYDNEWTDAMEELGGEEKASIKTLKTIVEKSYEFGKTRAASYVKGLEKAFLDLSNGVEVTDIISKYIKDHRKNTALLVLDGLYKSFVRDHKEYNVGGDGVKNFIKKAVSLCWLMAIQDPPVVLTTKLTGKFDTDHFRHYTKSGSTVDYVVWPVLFLHEGGPIICKGVAQGK